MPKTIPAADYLNRATFIRLVCVSMTSFFLCACAADKELPSRQTDAPNTAQIGVEKTRAAATQTMSQKRLLDIVAAQNKFFEKAKIGGKIQTASTVSEKRRMDSLWNEYLLDHPQDLDARILYGKFQRSCGENELAYKEFLIADKINPNVAVVKQQLAVFEAECDEGVSAYDNITRAVELNPSEPIYHVQAAQTLILFRDEIMKGKNMSRQTLDAKMLAHYEKATELSPEDGTLRWKYAQSFYDVHNADWQKALQQWNLILEKFAALNLEIETALANKARVLIELNRDSEAEAILKSLTNPNLDTPKTALLNEIERAKKAAAKDSAKNTNTK